jgi:hypothetical protein
VANLIGTSRKICTEGQRVELVQQIPEFESSIYQGMQKRVKTALPAKIPQNFVIILICAYVEASSHTKETLQEQNLALLSLYLDIPDCRYGEDSPR